MIEKTQQEHLDEVAAAMAAKKAQRQLDRDNSLRSARRLHDPFAIPFLGATPEFRASKLGRRESKCARAFAVVASCR
jgi:hypothetical protein